MLAFVTTKLKALFNIQKFSKRRKILGITAWIQRFVQHARNSQSKKYGLLLSEQLELAKNYWIKNTQMGHFPESYSALIQGKPMPINSAIQTFNPVLNERKIILRARLQRKLISYTTKLI